MSSIHLSKKELQNYFDCSPPTARSKEKAYKEIAGKNEKLELTIYDLCKLDDVPIEVVKQRCGKI